MKNLTASECAAWLKARDGYIILSHIRPDGDTIGSGAALCSALRRAGKTAYCYDNKGIKRMFAPFAAPYLAGEGFCADTVISVDVASERLFPEGFDGKVELAIDHHPTNTLFAENVCIAAEKAACGELVLEIIRELSPETIVWSSSLPDARWCGNERGVIAETNWCMATPEKLYPGGHDDVEVLTHGMEDGNRWAPAEADVSIRPGWFYHADQKPKTPEQLFDIYLTSVGRGGTLLLNLAPDTRGRVPEEDVASLMAWRKMVDETFANDLAAGAKAEASSSRGRGYGAECVIGEGGGYWATADDVTTGDVTLSWQNPQKINYVSIQEHIELGQRVRAFEIDVMDNGSWRKAAEGTTVGYKRIMPLGGVETTAVRVRFTDSRGPLTIERIAVY